MITDCILIISIWKATKDVFRHFGKNTPELKSVFMWKYLKHNIMMTAKYHVRAL